MNSDDDVRQKTGSTYGMTDDVDVTLNGHPCLTSDDSVSRVRMTVTDLPPSLVSRLTSAGIFQVPDRIDEKIQSEVRLAGYRFVSYDGFEISYRTGDRVNEVDVFVRIRRGDKYA